MAMEKDGGGYDDLVGSGTTGPAALAHGFPSLCGWPKKGDRFNGGVTQHHALLMFAGNPILLILLEHDPMFFVVPSCVRPGP
jgi:hypothetical protein